MDLAEPTKAVPIKTALKRWVKNRLIPGPLFSSFSVRPSASLYERLNKMLMVLKSLPAKTSQTELTYIATKMPPTSNYRH
jgi:hypothetical protein